MTVHAERLERARLSLEGLSVGDSFGQRFFREDNHIHIVDRTIPSGDWFFTDDTNMALSIYENLRRYQVIKQDELAISYANHYKLTRGYGAAMHGLLAHIRSGEDWRVAAASLFGGRGSFGNGGAMRVAPIGAYFADDMDTVIRNARLATEVTHTHPEASAGAIAVAVAAALAWQLKHANHAPDKRNFIAQVIEHVPESIVRAKLAIARDLPDDASMMLVVSALGNGSQITAQDTVPLVVWCAATYVTNFEDALWATVSAFGDIDTTCAMVGGIVALYTGYDGIPKKWLEQREKLPDWAFED